MCPVCHSMARNVHIILLMWGGMGDGMGWSGQCQRTGGATPGLGNQLFNTLWWYLLCGERGCCSDMSLAGAWCCSAEEDCPRKTDLVRAVLPCIGSE